MKKTIKLLKQLYETTKLLNETIQAEFPIGKGVQWDHGQYPQDGLVVGYFGGYGHPLGLQVENSHTRKVVRVSIHNATHRWDRTAHAFVSRDWQP